MRVRSPLVALILALWLCGHVLAPGHALARREVHFNYPFLRVWSTAVRLLRVDFACPITEKDREEGYFFFEYSDHGKTFPGSVELVPIKENGTENVRVVIQVPAMPSYVEAMMLDRLGRRLLEDFGTPKGATPPAADKPAPTPPAAGDKAPADPNAKPKPGNEAGSQPSSPPGPQPGSWGYRRDADKPTS